MAIDWLIFDAMGVIYSVGDDVGELLVPFIRQRNANTRPERIEAAYLEASLGHISAAEFWNQIGLIADYPEIEIEYLDSQLTLTDGFRSSAEQLSKQHNLAMLSNDVSDWSRHLRSRFDLDAYFEHYVISGDCGIRKPDDGIYEQLLTRVGAPPSACMFIDDRIKNLTTAKRMGFNTVLFSSAGELDRDGPYTIGSFSELPTILAALAAQS